ncbi:MAG: hypothetical protein NUW23_05825 [Firmicutes bacterium]|jgi:hypothetical protein|nr:hypothetical protein [Bacillota bacterium]
MRKRILVTTVAAAAVFMIFAASCSAQGGMGGNFANWVFLKLTDLNEGLEDAEYAPLPSTGMFMWGGYGMGDVKKWSIGGWGAGGGMTSTNDDNGKTSALSLGYGGMIFQYNVDISEKVRLGLGTGIGVGTVTLTTKQGIIDDFEDVLAGANSATVWRPYVVAQPYASLTFPVSPIVTARLSGGYAYFYGVTGWMDGFNWRQRFDGPLDTMGAPFVELGISFGPPPSQF